MDSECVLHTSTTLVSVFFFFNDTATIEIYTLSLHDALPIYQRRGAADQDRPGGQARRGRTAPRPQGQRHDRQLALRASGRRAHLPDARTREEIGRAHV